MSSNVSLNRETCVDTGVIGTFDPAMQGDETQPEKEYPGYMQFNVEIFQFFLLPIIIFSSAYNLPVRWVQEC